jgi:serine/threonine protein kinase
MLVGGRYETIRELGRGGLGKTYLAEDTYRRNSPKCVVKKIKPQSSSPVVLQTARDKFEAEVQMLYQLGTHAQIPRLLAHLEQNGEFYIVQELIDGHDLRQAFTLGDRWEEKKVIALLQEVLEILAFVHEHQAVHQDINPQSLIRRWQDKKLGLIDFGGIKSIRHLMVNDQGETILIQAIGTPGYMPPEQAAGQPQPASDIYAVGMMAIQALTGYFPNQLPRSETQEIEWHDQSQATLGMSAIVDHMTQIDPRHRYQSATEALAALSSLTAAKTTIRPEHLLAEPRQSEQRLPAYEIVISPRFDVALDFFEDLAAVVVDQELGYIDRTGEFVISPQFDFNPVILFQEKAYQFSQGLAPIAIAYKWGYINPSGKFAIKPQFDRADSFSDGLARVEIKNRYGYIDRAGSVVIAPQFDSATQVFSESLAGVEIDNCYGYIDPTGKVLILPRFDTADRFSEGLALVTLNGKYGFIDKAGELVIPAQFDVAHLFSEGLARVRIDGRYGYIDRTGAVQIPAQFDDTYSFTEGLALVRNQNKYGFINSSGHVVIPIQFDDAYPFSQGFAAVKVSNKWGYLDQKGEFVVNLQFDEARSFQGGLAAVRIAHRWGYLGQVGDGVRR